MIEWLIYRKPFRLYENKLASSLAYKQVLKSWPNPHNSENVVGMKIMKELELDIMLKIESPFYFTKEEILKKLESTNGDNLTI